MNQRKRPSNDSYLQLNQGKNTRKSPATSFSLRRLAAGWMIVQTLLLTTPALAQQKPKNELSYSQFLEKLENDEIAKVEIDKTTNKAKVVLKEQDPKESPKEVILFDQNQDLVPKILAKKDQVEFSINSSVDRSTTLGVLFNLVIIFILLGG